MNFIAFLRGINVSGQKMIKMTDLEKHLEELALKEIQTYIQSGNIIFRSELSSNKIIERQIEEKIEKKYGFFVPVIVRNIDEINKITNSCPFKLNEIENLKNLHVTFLSQIPTEDNLNALKSLQPPENEFYSLGESEIYLYCPNGYGKTKLSNNFFESKLKVKTTTRNWKTIVAVKDIMESML